MGLAIISYIYVETIKNLNNFFYEVFDELKCQPDTKAYIVSIFTKYKAADFDLSKDSITLTYAQAKDKRDFMIFQNLGDWIFFSQSFLPEHLNNASKEYYQSIGRLSYYSCYQIINKQWKLFEELSDNFIPLERVTRSILQRSGTLRIT